MRAGRKRKPGERYACGKLRVSEEELQRRMTPREAQPPDHGTPENQARRVALFGSPKATGELSCPVDLLRSRLSEPQIFAGRIARSTYARYCAAIMAPRVVAGQLTDFVEGSRTSSMTPEAAQRAVEDYKDLITAIRRYSFRSLKEVERVMHGSLPRNFDALAVGLTALADHLGFEEREAA
jgi:hypothetical protein